MSHNTKLRGAIVIAALLAGAFAAPARAQDEAAIRALDSAFMAAFQARDTVKIGTFFLTDAVGMYPNEPVRRGVPAIISSYAALSGLPAIRLHTVPGPVTISKGGDMAIATGTYHLNFNRPNGPAVADTGSYVEVLRKVNGQWRIANEIVTSSAAMPDMEAMMKEHMQSMGGTGTGGMKMEMAMPMTYDTVTSMGVTGATGLSWSPLNVPGFAPGAQMAVVHGDPGGGGDYTIRLKFPDGYTFPEHWHPKAEHVTVLSGEFLLGPGTNRSGWKTYAAGDFLYLPAKNSHSGGAKGATVIQLHGMGPFQINLGAPK